MTNTTHRTTTEPPARHGTGSPRIAGTAVAFTQNRHTQDDVARELIGVAPPGFERFVRTSGVDTRNLALPLSRYPEMNGFTAANDAYIEVAVDLGTQAVRAALDAAHVDPREVDAIVSVSSTGVAVPTFQPITSTVSGNSALRVARTAGPLGAVAYVGTRSAPVATTAAAPSPNRHTPMSAGIEESSRCSVSEHSSTDSSTATWPG